MSGMEYTTKLARYEYMFVERLFLNAKKGDSEENWMRQRTMQIEYLGGWDRATVNEGGTAR